MFFILINITIYRVQNMVYIFHRFLFFLDILDVIYNKVFDNYSHMGYNFCNMGFLNQYNTHSLKLQQSIIKKSFSY